MLGIIWNFLFRRHLVLNIFPLLVSTVKLMGHFAHFHNNRQSMGCFAYSFVPLCCANTIGPAIRIPPKGEVQRKKKNPRKLFIRVASLLATPVGVASVPCFANKRRMPHSANNINCGCYVYSVNTWRHGTCISSPIIPELAYNLHSTVLTENGHKVKLR